METEEHTQDAYVYVEVLSKSLTEEKMDELDQLERAIDSHDYLAAVVAIRKIGSSVPKSDLARSFFPEFDPDSIGWIQEAEDESAALFRLGTEFWACFDWQLTGVNVLRMAVDAGSRDALEVIGDVLNWLGA